MVTTFEEGENPIPQLKPEEGLPVQPPDGSFL